IWVSLGKPRDGKDFLPALRILPCLRQVCTHPRRSLDRKCLLDLQSCRRHLTVNIREAMKVAIHEEIGPVDGSVMTTGRELLVYHRGKVGVENPPSKHADQGGCPSRD